VRVTRRGVRRASETPRANSNTYSLRLAVEIGIHDVRAARARLSN
jgi:hypothetical protein